MDDDLQSLLNQLDIDGSDEEVKNITAEPVEASPPPVERVPEETILSTKIDDVSTATKIEDANEGDIVNHTKKYLTKLDDVTDEILSACRSDRQEAQEVIVLYKSQIEDALTNSRDPQRMYVDGLVQAVEVKSNINLAMVKIMEANAKMLASLKAGSSLNIKNNINVAASNDKELERILDEPITEIDDY